LIWRLVLPPHRPRPKCRQACDGAAEQPKEMPPLHNPSPIAKRFLTAYGSIAIARLQSRF
jgi:hypothetical protein